MKGIYRTIFSVFLLFSALLATVAALPAPFSNTNTSLLQQPNPPATSLDLVTFRKIILAFTSFGQEIPESEVEDTFTGAERAINDLVEAHPDERITNDQFNFRREHGNTLILISANVGGSITWRELSRVLQSLHRFMSGGAGVPDEHYQALEFKIQALPLIDVGFGLIWYFPPGSAIMQKRASPPLPISIAQETDLLASNAASLLLGPNANDDPVLYPIPRTCLTLKFYFLGVPIPADIVKFTLQGALAKVRPWLNGAHENDTITNDYYQYTTPFTHGTPRVAVTVFSYRGHSMSWRILFEVLFGLFQFATSFSGSNLKQEHYQILGFRIFEESFGKLGVGTISCYIPGEVDSVKRAQAGKEIFDGSALSRKTAPRVPQLPQVSNSTPLHSADARNAESTSPTAVATSVVWPIFGTDILLTFTFLGDPIPPHEVTATVMGAQRYILPILDQSPNLPIMDNHIRYRSNDELVAISVLAYRDKVITWTKLSQVLAGMLQFCVDNHNQVLVFEIDIGEQGRVGFGTFLYAHASRNERAVEKRALLSTAFLPSNAAISPSSPVGTPAAIRFPILLSQDNLLFTDHGPAIPSNELRVNLEYALKDTGLMIDEFPNQVLHSGAYEVQDENLTITISAHTGYEITWLQLDDILLGLRDFVTGCGSHSQTYFQALDFQVNRPGQGNVAYGLVRYTPGSARFSPSNPFEAGKRALQATLSLPSQLAFETEILFRIPGTSDTLVVNDLGVHIPGKLLSRALWHCLDNIWDHINTGPLDPIPRREDDCTFEGVTIATSCHQAAHPQYVISWMTLQDIVDGLNVFTQGDWRTAESQMHRQILEFQLDLEYFGKFVHGFLLYNAQVLTETGNGALNSTLLEMGSVASNSRLTSRNIDKTENRNSNTTPPLPILAVFSNFIPYAIPGTPVTLVITSLGDTIPSLEVGAGLTNALRRISSSAISRAHMPIPGNRYWYRDNISHLCFHVLSRNSRQVITWQQLSWTVAGLSQWMQGDHCRELSFVINVDGEGTIGFGSVGHGPLPIGIPTGLVKTEKRAELPNETFWQLPTSAKAANTGPLHISAITNETLVQLPNATKWPSLATDECIYTPDTGLDICFHHFGDPIPSQQVSLLFTCILRDLPISKDTIPAILYQLRTPDRKVTGQTSILVEWIPHYDFAYDALNRVMQRLERYMIGHGSESSASPHLQNLEFVLQADGIALGTGQVWHLPGKHGVAKRGIVNDDVLLLPNTTSTSALQAVGAISPYSFLVIGTSITLQFYYFSTGMPGFGFQAISTLRNALAKIDPCVETTPNAPIAGDAFQYSKRFGHTKILVFIYTLGSNTISWRDLDAVLDGLAWFMQRDPITSQPCNQGSKFQINADGIGKIGLGTLWWSTGTGALEQRAEAANHVSQPSNSSLSLPGAPFAFPVPGTPITLMISFIARPIKGIGQQASSLIVVALSHLEPLVDQNPEGTITHNFFEVSKVFDNPSGRLTIRIRSHEAHDVSWRDLQNVLEGLNEFYIHDPATGSYRDWASRFQVNKAGLGTTGQGILTFVRSTVAKRTSVAISLSRSSNTSLSLPEFATPTPFPVPETSLTLICNNIGEFIPDFGRDSSYVIVGARLKIMHLVEQYPDGRVPNNRYQYSEVYSIDQKVSIVVYAYGDHDITWIELDDILLGLTSYQLGDVEAGVVGHDQGVQFTVDKNGEGRIGLGNLRSSTTARSVSKRATSSTSPSSSNETLLKTINTTLLVSPPANTSTPNSVSESVDPPLPIPFPIEGTSLSLSITGIGTTSIPYSIVHDLFTGAFASINHDWVTHPNDSMTFPYFQYSAQSVHGEMVSISVHHNMWNEVTWWQLSRILGGVQEFMVGGVCMSRGVSFEVGGNRRVIGTGLVYYSSRSSGGRVVERSFEG